MYGDVLAPPPSPMGTPPPVKTPPPMPAAAAPTPQAGPTPVPPVVPAPPPTAEMVAANEEQHRKAYEQHLENFASQAVADYAAKRISRDDLKKAVSYTGTDKYPEWRHQNVEHLKAIAKARE